jgi:UDP-N-acetylmuramoyl-tripeptide--D-alanyl-D-alanine ligase
MRHFFKIMKTDQIYEFFKKSSGISTDSRSTKKGDLFFALWGEKYNGNKYASDALEKGALCAIIDDPSFENEKTLLVDDCLSELQALASFHRRMLNVPVLAVTGTNGKTTTKELLASVISKKLKIHYTKGNLNNHIGVPLTILSAPKDTQMMIIEMGANHISEIRSLCSIAKPDYGLITNIGTAHIEGFGSAEGVIRTKIELYDYLRKINGIAFFNDKNNLLKEKIYKIVNRAIPYSYPTGIELLLDTVPQGDNLTLSLVAEYEHKKYNIKTNLFGEYNIENIKASIAVGLFFGVEMNNIIDAISSYVPENNRSQIKKTNSNLLICDSYNANPTSMGLALHSLNNSGIGRKMLILGDMLELGDRSEEEHLKILESIVSLKFDKVLLVGPIFKKISEKYGFKSFSNTAGIIDFIRNEKPEGYSILIKGSRGIGLEKIYDLL